jgi:hypothetical protein
MLATAHGLRATDIANNIGVQNLETPWHVLLTVEAMVQTPARTRSFP